MPRSAAAGGPTARTLLRGLTLLELIAEDRHEGSVTQLAQAAGLDKGTTSRLLATLREAGYLRQGSDHRYRLTGRVLQLADGYSSQLDLRGVAHQWLTRIRDEVDETVHLGVLEERQIVYIDKVESRRSLRLVSRLGHVEPAHHTALGKAILSSLPVAERERWVAAAPVDDASWSITAPHDLLADLEESRQRGFAIDREEVNQGVACVGAAILDADGTPLAALSCSGPADRVLGHLDELGDLCRRTADAITAELAGRPPAP